MRLRLEFSRRLQGGILVVSFLVSGMTVPPASGMAQGLNSGPDIEAAISTLTVNDAALYVRSVTSGIGASMNSAWFSTASVHGLGGFDIGVRMVGALVPSEQDFFSPSLPSSLVFQGQTFTDPLGPKNGGALLTPTATGEGDGIVVAPQGEFLDAILASGQNPASFELAFPGGFDFPIVPFAALQASVGVGAGTEVTLRFVPRFEPDKDIGSVSMFGFGFKHSLDQWIPHSPLRLAVAFGHTEFDVGSYLDANSNALSLIASVGGPALTLYAAGTYEDSNLNIKYNFVNPGNLPGLPADGALVQFSQDGANSSRLTLGTTVGFGPGRLNVDYAVAEFNVLSAGLIFGVR